MVKNDPAAAMTVEGVSARALYARAIPIMTVRERGVALRASPAEEAVLPLGDLPLSLPRRDQNGDRPRSSDRPVCGRAMWPCLPIACGMDDLHILEVCTRSPTRAHPRGGVTAGRGGADYNC